MNLLKDTVTPVPDVGKYYTFVYNAKTPSIQYDQHPLVAVTDIFSWDLEESIFTGNHLEITHGRTHSQLYVVNYNELDDLLAIPYAKFITK